eukprot:gb/GEZN01016757.1/.p1 GENE.gb/GEZN01016757.1/~~gb/GEZN01016757.1/.p1  ORF type:complete len:210 (+),score=43.18 gb/GEZN01016757.1/:132-761(+)
MGKTKLGKPRCAQVSKRAKWLKAGPQAGQTKKAKVQAPESEFYNPEDVKRPIPSRKNRAKQTKLRASVVPGAVLILLSGKFKGKRVVFLKQLESGLLLVTGPYKINGVPLRRVNQAYVIGTSTRVDISKVDVSKIGDDFFARPKADKGKDAEFFSEESKKTERSAEKKAAQVKVDKSILAAIKGEEFLKHYLNAKFSLTRGQKPHALKF